MVEKRRPIWSSLDVSFSSPTTVDKEPFLCTLKKLYNLYSGFTHYRNYRAITTTWSASWADFLIFEGNIGKGYN